MRPGELPTPGAPGEGEVLLAVKAVGICGSDLHLYRNGQIGGIGSAEPFVYGHEFSGEILETGAGAVSGSGKELHAGQLVAVDPHLACGKCEHCQLGNPNLCPHHRFIGLHPTRGALTEQIIVPAESTHPVPEAFSPALAALIEPLGVAVHALDLAHLRPGMEVAVVGAGSIGLMIARLAQRAGASRVFINDPLPWRVEQARLWGLDAKETTGESFCKQIEQATGGRGVDVAFEAAWAGEAINDALAVAKPGARVVLVGIPDGDDCVIRHSTARRKGLCLVFARRSRHTYPRAIGLAASDERLPEILTHTWPLESANTAFSATSRPENGLIKTTILIESS